MENLKIWEQVRAVPDNAQKAIGGGRLKGMTDINPVWRIKTLTEIFGPAGIGWKTETLDRWIVDGANGEKAAFVEINLFVKNGNEWSEPIFGTGGSMFVSQEKNGLHTDDECFKKAYTDAISVACKALGIGADVYWQKDSTKYTEKPTGAPPQQQKPAPDSEVSKQREEIRALILEMANGDIEHAKAILKQITSFTGKDGKEVAGKVSVDLLTDKQVPYTLKDVKRAYEAERNATEA